MSVSAIVSPKGAQALGPGYRGGELPFAQALAYTLILGAIVVLLAP
jgi:hypothetical protein